MDTKDMNAVILAGGKSSRMGQNKLFLPLGDKPIIGHLIERLSKLFAQTIVVTDEPQLYRHFPVDITQDFIMTEHKNSLTGIHAGLLAARSPYVFVAAGDMPFVQTDVIRYLCAMAEIYDVIVPLEGVYFQPLCAVYHQRCIPVIERQMSLGQFRVTQFLASVNSHAVEQKDIEQIDPEFLSFFNVNTPQEYRAAQEIYAKQQLLKEGGH